MSGDDDSGVPNVMCCCETCEPTAAVKRVRVADLPIPVPTTMRQQVPVLVYRHSFSNETKSSVAERPIPAAIPT